MKLPNLDPFKSKFSESKLLSFIGKRFQKAGAQIVYASLLMYYAYQRKETPIWAKNIIIGSLGYLISPIDMLPDLTPILGFTDDFGVLSFGLVTISCYINPDIKDKAKNKLQSWFKINSFDMLETIDERL